MNINQLLYLASIALTGLLAGLFYGYQCSVINGLGRLNDKAYLLAFRSINKAILNPVFFLSFMGSLFILAISTFVFYKTGDTQILPYVVTSLIIYAIGVFGITVAFNVPLNESLASSDINTLSANQLKEMRLQFEGTWNKWHLIRTIASIASFICLIIPLIKKI
ncbi:anthrone oxygenase family protein [Parapedobacter tibetensis]|uniref:anthrone oxygenase family protein n=1 Tax=Parapedobacter tibetensis TaxID=2972951 RepID=UPI00214D1E71|nr:anthrone oxygenase family protein [Parapedobacter tibetensis]